MSTTPRSIQRPLRFSGTPTPTIRVTSPIPDAIAVIDIWDPEVLEEPVPSVPSPTKSYSIRYHPDKDDPPSTASTSDPDLSTPTTTTAGVPIDLPATAGGVSSDTPEDPHSLMVLSKLPEMETDSGSSDEEETSQATTLVRSPRPTLAQHDQGPSPAVSSGPSSSSVSMDCSDFPPPPPPSASDSIASANLDLELPWPPVPCCTPERTSACSSMETTTPDSIPELLNVHPEPGNYGSPETGTDSAQVGNRVKTSTSEKDFRRGATDNLASAPRRQSWSHGHGALPVDPGKEGIINKPEGARALVEAQEDAKEPKSVASSADQRHGETESNKACMDHEINIIENPSCAEEENDIMLQAPEKSPELASASVRVKKGKKVQFGRSLSYSTEHQEPTAGPSSKPDSKKYYLGRRASSYDSPADRTAYLVVKSGSDSFSQIAEKPGTEEVEEQNQVVTHTVVVPEESEPLLTAAQTPSASSNTSQSASMTNAKKGVSMIEPQQQQQQQKFTEGFSPIPEDDTVSVTEDKPDAEEDAEDDHDHEASPSMKPAENVEQFKKDPQLMEIATRFVADVVAKAKEEAARRAKVEKMNLELEGATRKNLPWYRRIRVVLWRAFSCTCVGSGHDLQSPL